jgi:hypothetical protein
MNTDLSYPEFGYAPNEINKYIEALGLFSILLKNGNIVHFTPQNREDFRMWLTRHNIKDILRN